MPNTIKAALEDGMVKTVFLAEDPKDLTAPTVAELSAATVLDLSYYLTSDGFALEHSQESIEDDREGAAEAGEIPGRETYTGTSLKVIDNTNQVGSDNKPLENAAVTTLTKGKQGTIVRRRGKPTDDAFAAGDVVSVFPVTIGIKSPIAHAANQRQLSQINFSVRTGAQDETAVVGGTGTSKG